MNEKKNELQMSEAFLTSIFLAVSGGFQDAYTYNTREEVFSNAQTGNVVLMSQHFMCGEWMAGLRYLFPILSFAVGVWRVFCGAHTGAFQTREAASLETGNSAA